MASAKTKTSSSRSRAKTSSARTRSARQTSTTAGDNQPGSDAVNNAANAESRAAVAAATGEQPKVALKQLEAAILAEPGEPLTSLNNLPKAEGGLPADEIARLRSTLDSVRGDAALGQPGQAGHGIGTGTAGLTGSMTDEEIEANEKEYAKRISA